MASRFYRRVLSWTEYLKYRFSQSKKWSTAGEDTHPRSFWSVLRNTAVSCSLYTLGDVCEQRVENYGNEGNGKSSANDWSRTRRMATMGAFIGVIDTYWYTRLDELLPGASGRTVAKKVLLDQIIWSPICCTTYFYGMSRMEGSTTAEAVNKVKEKFWPTYKVDWLLWPPAQAINFFLVPPKYRVICVAFITFIWTVFLSYMQHKKITHLTTSSTPTDSTATVLKPS